MRVLDHSISPECFRDCYDVLVLAYCGPRGFAARPERATRFNRWKERV